MIEITQERNANNNRCDDCDSRPLFLWCIRLARGWLKICGHCKNKLRTQLNYVADNHSPST